MILHQLDEYHILQAIGRTFGWKSDQLKNKVKKAIKTKDLKAFQLEMNCYESTLEEEKHLENS